MNTHYTLHIYHGNTDKLSIDKFSLFTCKLLAGWKSKLNYDTRLHCINTNHCLEIKHLHKYNLPTMGHLVLFITSTYVQILKNKPGILINSSSNQPVNLLI